MFTYGDGLDRLRTRAYNRSVKQWKGESRDVIKTYKYAMQRGLAYDVFETAKDTGITKKAAINLVDDKYIESVKEVWGD